MTAYQDSFAKDRLPPPGQWPELIHLEELGYPETLNCAGPLLDDAVSEGHGGRTVITTPEGSWTYAELQADANRIARVLTEDLGLISGNRVLLRGPNNYMMVACWFGVVKAGGIAVATMPLLRAPELKTILNKAEIRFALCDHRLLDELNQARPDSMLEHVLAFGNSDLEGQMVSKPAEFPTFPARQNDVCLIAFTSGTTGLPKAAAHFHRDMLTICKTYSAECLQPVSEDRFIGSPPLAFTFGLGGLVLFPMHARASTILLEQAGPDQLLEAIRRYEATAVFTSPTAYRFMLNHLDQSPLPSLRVGVSAGETLPQPTFDAWKEKTGMELLDGIGSTEMLHIFISSRPDRLRPGATGTPVPGYEAQVVDEEMNPVPPGKTGILAVRGPTGCTYLDDERQQKYVREGWNLTGDAYQVDEEGFFWFQARTDDMIISSGYNIAGPEVEAALMAHPSVAECAVIGVADEQRGQLVKAFVVLREEQEASAEKGSELQEFVKNTIAPYKYPRRIEFVSTLPKTETGKVQRFRLRQQESG